MDKKIRETQLNTYLLFCEHFNRLAFPIDQRDTLWICMFFSGTFQEQWLS